jgi:hypothetical protein
MAKHKPKGALAKSSGPRAPEPWDHIPRSGDDWVMPELYTMPNRPWKGYFNFVRTRSAEMGEAEWASWQYLGCYQNEFMGLYLFLYQDLATRKGYPQRCTLGPCRRKGLCQGRRPARLENWAMPLEPIIPLCVPEDPDATEAFRNEAREEYYAAGRKAGALWAFRPGDVKP